MLLPSESAVQLADRLFASQTSASAAMQRAEQHQQVREALDSLSGTDREVLVLVYLERLSPSEAAAVLGISVDAMRPRLRRRAVAIRRAD